MIVDDNAAFVCVCCGVPSSYSICLAVGDDVAGRPRYYLPNLTARENPEGCREVSFCAACMRRVEDAVRATILYLQTEEL